MLTASQPTKIKLNNNNRVTNVWLEMCASKKYTLGLWNGEVPRNLFMEWISVDSIST